MSTITSFANDLQARVTQDLQTFPGFARLFVNVCVAAILIAVALNFWLARNAHAVRARRKSVVETGSMLAFFIGVYCLIRYRVGVHDIGAAYYPLAISGLVLLGLGTALNLAGRFALGRNWGNQVIIYQDHTLVRSGVYGIVRHPLYAGLVWMFVGASLVFQNWAALSATVLLFVPGMAYRATQEERALSSQFPEYEDYRKKTGMLVPVAMGPEVMQLPRQAFAFCRISLTVLLWGALVWKSTWLVLVVFGLLAMSMMLKVQRSPMVQLYWQTVLRIFPTENHVFLDVPAMRFAHGMGATMALVVWVLLQANPSTGRYWLAAFCVIKTISAFGFCPASKLFVCLRKGGCCALTRRKCEAKSAALQ
jgi:protein-S-isoprenylcysteine O-methyltransferase Ste14